MRWVRSPSIGREGDQGLRTGALQDSGQKKREGIRSGIRGGAAGREEEDPGGALVSARGYPAEVAPAALLV